MAERARAKINLVAEELLAKLQDIGRFDNFKWLTTPRTVEMMTGPADLKKPRPGIFLEVVEAEPDDKRSLTTHGEIAHFLIHCTSESVVDPSGTCHDLMADVARQLRENPHLDTASGVLRTGYIRDGRRKCSIESAESGSGLAVGFVEARAFYLTSDAEP